MSSVYDSSEPATHPPEGGTTDMKLEVVSSTCLTSIGPRISTRGWADGLTPISSPGRTSGWCSSGPLARHARSSSGRPSPRRPPDRRRDSISSSRTFQAAHDRLIEHGAQVSEVFHDAGGVFHHAGTTGRVSGPDPERHSYGSFASFEDPVGIGWDFPEIRTRLPGRIDPAATSLASASDLARALQRAAGVHGQHEARIGWEDPDGPDWHAEYMVRERAGDELPS